MHRNTTVFKNKTQAIISQYRGTQVYTIQNTQKSQCTWISATIDDTYIPRCVATMGKGFKFSLDVDIGADTALEYDKHLILSQYLQEVSNNSSLSILLRKVLIDER